MVSFSYIGFYISKVGISERGLTGNRQWTLKKAAQIQVQVLSFRLWSGNSGWNDIFLCRRQTDAPVFIITINKYNGYRLIGFRSLCVASALLLGLKTGLVSAEQIQCRRDFSRRGEDADSCHSRKYDDWLDGDANPLAMFRRRVIAAISVGVEDVSITN